MNKALNQMPTGNIIKSEATIKDIREKISGALQDDYLKYSRDSGTMDILLCLANKIHELEEEIKNLKDEKT